MTSFSSRQLEHHGDDVSLYAREPPASQFERGLELELWMINSTRQLKDLNAILMKHESALSSAPLRLRRSLRKQINKAEALLAKVVVAKKGKKKKNVRNVHKTEQAKARHRIIIEQELTKAKSHIELQDEIHRSTLKQFSKEREALENKIRAQRRVIDQIISKSSEDKEMLSTIIRKMHIEEDDEAWPSKLLLSQDPNPWNNRIYKPPNADTNCISNRRPPIHMPLNFTSDHVSLWKKHPLILPNLIALNTYAKQSEHAVCQISAPSHSYEGLQLVERGEQCKRKFMFHMRNEHLGAGRVKVYVSFDGQCSASWMYPEENALLFGKMLLEGLECVENRSARDGAETMTWDLVFTPGGRMSVEMVAEGGSNRISMMPMKQVQLSTSRDSDARNYETPSGHSRSVNSTPNNRMPRNVVDSHYLKGELCT